ncbi:hypothetical protein MMC31_003744 [Peltigera leucophlebia]|nr:hypothetical protein [Peltigera leucophlebia]
MKSIEKPHFDAEETWISDALERKRTQIGQEIEDFKTEKEREFAAFEQRLRGRGRSTSSEYSSSYGKREEPRESNLTFDGRSPVINIGSDSVRTNGINHLSQLTGFLCDGQENEQSSSNSLLSNSLRERECEFHGLFTPHYLPLLDSSAHTSKSRPTTNQPEDLQPPRDTTSNFSSSATFPASTLGNTTSPPSLRHFSASVPRERSLSLRLSSSRSETSIGRRRSSLRDPKQPRSAKRVLFSINDVVLSPSTSPVLSSSTAAPQARDIDSLPSNKLAKMPTRKSKGTETWGKGLSALLDPINNTSLTASSKYSYTPYGINSSSSTILLNNEDDDFSPNYDTDGDDLFAFDEEVNVSDDDDDDDDHDISGKTAIGSSSASGYNSDEEGDGKDPDMTVGSPGAGSLPIEIKWPGRRDL